MAYDRADWHYKRDFPDDLPKEASGTHIAFFIVWMILNGHPGEIHLDDDKDCIGPLRERELTPGQWFFQWCCAKFWRSDLDEAGNAFASQYYASVDDGYGPYIDDYRKVLEAEPTLYHVADTWQNFDKLAPLIARRYGEFFNPLPPPAR